MGRPDGCLGNVRMLMFQLSFGPAGIPVVGEDQVTATAVGDTGSYGVAVNQILSATLALMPDDGGLFFGVVDYIECLPHFYGLWVSDRSSKILGCDPTTRKFPGCH